MNTITRTKTSKRVAGSGVGALAIAIVTIVGAVTIDKPLHADDLIMLNPPCRLHDSRQAGAYKLVANTELDCQARDVCGIPRHATGVFLTFTVIAPPANGWLKAYAKGLSTAPDTAVLTYTSGVTTTGSSLVALRDFDPFANIFDFVLKSSQSADFVTDVTAYITDCPAYNEYLAGIPTCTGASAGCLDPTSSSAVRGDSNRTASLCYSRIYQHGEATHCGTAGLCRPL